MKHKTFKRITFIFSLAFTLFFVNAQQIRGKVTDESGDGLPGVNILEKGTSNGTTTDIDGGYNLNVNYGATLVFSFVGYQTKEIITAGQSELDVVLNEGVVLEDVIFVGSRAVLRSATSTPLPVDVLSSDEIASTGQTTFDKALQYRIPSFNTVQTPVNDATSLLDPYEIRNMGPSRTLILINGKRKNLSALLYTQTSPGKGETGADISGIPQDAIKRVEVLRDGASAQYGSDAIAGVMNIILKDNPGDGSVTLRTGITGKGDGETFGISINNGSKVGGDNGFVNYTIDMSKVNLANRPGVVSAEGEANDFKKNSIVTNEDLIEINNFLDRRPDAGNINGSPETTAMKFLLNGDYNLSENTTFYYNSAYIFKKVNSFANYRTPYWRRIQSFPYLGNFFPGDNPFNNGNYTDAYGNTFKGNGYDGYLPTFDGDLNDFNATLGFKAESNGWNYDVSATYGGNKQTYKVENSHNRNEVYSPAIWVDKNGNGIQDPGEVTSSSRLYQENSQISFDPGGTKFEHIVGNLDVSKSLLDNLSIGVGAELRSEIFTIIPGELSSYDGGGADSFSGNRPANSGSFNRVNFGGYFDLALDITEDLLFNGTMRAENYSDFGNAFVWKISSRYKLINDKFTLRSSLSTGFRAPTLHQIYTQKAQYSFVPGKAIQVGGLINNVSREARLLKLPKLKPEKSNNFTLGVGGKVNTNLNFTADYYYIEVEDRIVLGTEISATKAGNTALDKFLVENNLSDLRFFSNAINTITSGIDVVVNYKNIALSSGILGFTLSGNYTLENKRIGNVKKPEIVKEAGQTLVDRTNDALFFTSRPKTKWILGANYEINKFSFSLNNTYFGKTIFRQQGLNDNLRTEFTPKIVTDLGLNYNVNEKLTLALNVNNIFNVLPKWNFVAENKAGQDIIDSKVKVKKLSGITEIQNQSNLITFNQRYSRMTYDGYHFSQLGTLFNFSVNYRF